MKLITKTILASTLLSLGMTSGVLAVAKPTPVTATGEARTSLPKTTMANDKAMPVKTDTKAMTADQKAAMMKADEAKKAMMVADREAAMMKKAEDMKAMIAKKKDAVMAIIDAKEKAREAKFSKIKDATKKASALAIAKSLNAVNQAVMEKDLTVLDNLDRIVGNIKTRAAKMTTDMSAVNTAIETAQSALSTAREAVAKQISNVYDVAVSTDTTVKANIEASRNALHKDLMTVETSIKNAREAVSKAAKLLTPSVAQDVTQPAPSADTNKQ